MKEFWYSVLEDYLSKAEAYDNPKQLKMFEVNDTVVSEKKLVRAVTYIRTALFGWQEEVTKEEVEGISTRLRSCGHSRGVILEVGKLG